MRIFLDANILFSGALPQSRMRALLEILFDKAECLTNQYAVEEARRNLELKLPSQLTELTALVDRCANVGGIVAGLPIQLDPKDIPILGGAVAGRTTHLLTGDVRHFGAHFGNTVEGVKIVSPKMLAEELLKLGWVEL